MSRCGAKRPTPDNPWLERRVSDLYHSHTAPEPVGRAGGCRGGCRDGVRQDEDPRAAGGAGALRPAAERGVSGFPPAFLGLCEQCYKSAAGQSLVYDLP